MTGAPQDLLALRRALENIITRRQREEGLSFSATQYRGVRLSGGHLSVYGETADALFRVLDRAETYAAAIDAVLAEHSRRVTELLEANNREVESRRSFQRENDKLKARARKLREALDNALTTIACTIAFLGRDRGTDRQDSMLDGITAELVNEDSKIRAALSAPTTLNPVKFGEDLYD